MISPDQWHRPYLRAEWKLRRSEKSVQKLRKKYSYLKELCASLKHNLTTTQRQARSQEMLIMSQKNMLKRYNTPPFESFLLCEPSPDEICPLSQTPITTSFLPFAPGVVYNPSRPHHTCTELGCGHRFSSMYLIYYFVKQSTFRCPLCRSGPRNFHFSIAEIPAHLHELFQHASE